MNSRGEQFFGQILLKNKLVTQAQLDECLGVQEQSRAIGYALSLGRVMVNKGYPSDAQVAQVVKAQRVTEVIREDYIYGRIAAKNGLVHDDQHPEFLEKQKDRSEERL